jgi:hypothetical protein
MLSIMICRRINDLRSGCLVSLSARLLLRVKRTRGGKRENRAGLRLFGKVTTRVVAGLSCVRALLTWHG